MQDSQRRRTPGPDRTGAARKGEMARTGAPPEEENSGRFTIPGEIAAAPTGTPATPSHGKATGAALPGHRPEGASACAEEASAGKSRAGFAAFIGEPNAGKSTLTNRLVGAKVSIVTHKVQTTRTPIRGITIHGKTQIVFVDTPGLFRPKRRLDRAMVSAAWGGAGDADAVVLLVEAQKGVTEGVRQIVASLGERLPRRTRVAVAINKIDRVKPARLLPLAAELGALHPFERVFMISAEKGDGTEDLLDWLAEVMPEGPWLYPEDQIADAPLRLLAAEITREKLMLRLHEEIPYQLTVETESWEERRDGSVRVDQIVYVMRDGHKGIVLGKGGETIKAVSRAARLDLAEFLGRKVHLFLTVKVRPGWQEEAERYASIGLDIADS